MKTLNSIFKVLLITLLSNTLYAQHPARIMIINPNTGQMLNHLQNSNQNPFVINIFYSKQDTNAFQVSFGLENHDSNSVTYISKTFQFTNSNYNSTNNTYYQMFTDTFSFFHSSYMHDLIIDGTQPIKLNQSWKFQHYNIDFELGFGIPYFSNTFPNGYYFDSTYNNYVYGGAYGPYTYFSIYHNMDSIFLNADYIGVEADFMRYLPNGNCDSNAISVNYTDTSNYYAPQYEEQYMYYIPEDSTIRIKKLINPENFGSVHFGLTHNCNTYFDNIRLYPVYDKYICQGDSLEINGVFQQEEGVYIDSLLTVLGTDSIIGINLKHNTAIYGDTIFATICENETFYLYDTLPITNPGNFTFLTTTPQGCDSIFHLNLTIQDNTISTEITNTNNVLSYNDPQSGYTYQWIDLNTNQPIVGQTSSVFTPQTNGNYAVDVSDGICTQRSNESNTTIGTLEWSNEIHISPNPFSDHIQIGFEDIQPKISIRITDIQSKLVYQETYIHTSKIEINGSHFENGIYLLTLNDGIHVVTKQIIRLQ